MILRDQNDLQISESYATLRDQSDLQIDLSGGRVIILSPTDGQTDFPEGGLYEWAFSGEEQVFRVEVATDSGFSTIVQTADVEANQLASTVAVSTGYFIRISALEPVTPSTPNEVTGISISSGSTIEQNGSRQFTITVSGTGSFNENYTASGTGLTFSIDGSTLTVTDVSGSDGQQKTFTVESEADNTITASRTLTVQAESDWVLDDSKEGEALFLEELAVATDYQNWTTNTGWSTNIDPNNMGALYGVTVYPSGDPNEGRIQHIRLFNNNLVNIETDVNGDPIVDNEGLATERYRFISGREVPQTIGNLRHMKFLEINLNKLSGPIPASFWTLDNLEVACLGYDRQEDHSNNTNNDFVNENSFYPTKSDYGGNKFTLNNGVGISPAIGNMTALKRLFLERNYFDNTGIPDEVTTLPNLEKLFISSNGLTGNLPLNIGNLGNTLNALQTLGGRATFNRNNVRVVDPLPSDHLYLSGQLRESYGNLSLLTESRISYNEFTGPIPSTWANLDEMVHIYFNGFKVGGQYPNFLDNRPENTPNLSTLRAAFNELSGSFDPDSDWSNLGVLELEGNDMTGAMPNCFQDHTHPGFPRLIILMNIRPFNSSRSQMQLTGGIAQDLSGMVRVKQIRINSMALSGTLPQVWPQNNGLTLLQWFGNQFSGNFPVGFGDIKSNTDLNVSFSSNNLSGYQQGAISPLVLDGSGNYVSGLRTLYRFFISNNDLPQSALDNIILDMDANVQSRIGTDWDNFAVGGSQEGNSTIAMTGQSTGDGPSNTTEINDAISRLESAGFEVLIDGDRTPQT